LIDAGNKMTIGSGTWRLVRGTRAYAHLAGHGRLAVVTQTGYGDLTWRAEGFFSQR
jgi:hypothetical protein